MQSGLSSMQQAGLSADIPRKAKRPNLKGASFVAAGAKEKSLHPVLISAVRSNKAIACIALGPDQQQQVLAGRVRVDLAYELIGRGNGVTIDLEDHIPRGDPGILCGAGRTYALHGNSVKLSGDLKLLAGIRGQIADGQTELAALRAVRTTLVAGDLSLAMVAADGEIHILELAVAQNPE